MSFEPHFDLDLRGDTFPLSRERLLLLNVDHDVFGTFSSFFHFDRSMRLHFRYEKFPPSSSLLSSLRGSSPREPLDSKEGKSTPLFAREKFNSFPPPSFVEYSPRFPRDPSRVPFPSFLSFPPFFIFVDRLTQLWEIRKFFRALRLFNSVRYFFI